MVNILTRHSKLLCLLMALPFLTLPAVAAPVTVFDNFPINGTKNAYGFSNPNSISDSFVLSSPATLSQLNIGVWLQSGNTPTGATWAIGTTPFASDLGTGSAGFSYSNLFTHTLNGWSYNIDSVSFSLPNVSLGVGTYYLTLSNGTGAQNNWIAWDENDGAGPDGGSITYHLWSMDGGSNYDTRAGAEAFQLLGTLDSTTATPEPTTDALLGSGLFGVWFLRRKLARG
jgi:hypothetical protein